MTYLELVYEAGIVLLLRKSLGNKNRVVARPQESRKRSARLSTPYVVVTAGVTREQPLPRLNPAARSYAFNP